MSDTTRLKPQLKIWLETDEGYVFGPGVYSLLRQVEETGTLKKAAEYLGMSYRYAWGMIKKAEKKLGLPLFITYKGGRTGGGGTEVTTEGKAYMEYFSNVRRRIEKLSEFLPNFYEEDLNSIKVEIISIQDQGDKVNLTFQPIEDFSFSAKIEKTKVTDLSPGDKIFIEYTIILNNLERHPIKDL